MSNDKTTETESQSGPDGFVIIHRPKDETVTPYGIGPFPPMEGLADKVIAATTCGCECMALYIAFPKGIRMAIIPDEDSPTAMALLALMEQLMGTPEGPVH